MLLIRPVGPGGPTLPADCLLPLPNKFQTGIPVLFKLLVGRNQSQPVVYGLADEHTIKRILMRQSRQTMKRGRNFAGQCQLFETENG